MTNPQDIIGIVKGLQEKCMQKGGEWVIFPAEQEFIVNNFPAIAQALLDREEKLKMLEKANKELRILNNSVFNVSRKESYSQKTRGDELEVKLKIAVEAMQAALERMEVCYPDGSSKAEEYLTIALSRIRSSSKP